MVPGVLLRGAADVAGVVVLDQTPFYAESGGQVGDQGELVGSGGTFSVADTQKIQPDVFGHHGTLKSGALKVGDKVEAHVDAERRQRTMRNHSVTHLMHTALLWCLERWLGWSALACGPLALLLLVILASMIHRYIERPAAAMRRRLAAYL